MATPTAKVVLITGCSSGLGESVAKLFALKGWNVVATMRNPQCEGGVELSKNPNMLVLALDVMKEDTISTAVERTVDTFGRLDVLVNNAGLAVSGPVELATGEQLLKQYDTNLLGPIRMMQQVIPVMRRQKSGTIVNITSIGAFMPLPMNALYNGTKYGLEGVSECMALEVAPFRIKIRLVQPGLIVTPFAVKSTIRVNFEIVKDYDAMYSNAYDRYREMGAEASSAEDIAAVVHEAATFEGHKIRFIAGNDAVKLLARRKSIADERQQEILSTDFKMQL